MSKNKNNDFITLSNTASLYTVGLKTQQKNFTKFLSQNSEIAWSPLDITYMATDMFPEMAVQGTFAFPLLGGYLLQLFSLSRYTPTIIN